MSLLSCHLGFIVYQRGVSLMKNIVPMRRYFLMRSRSPILGKIWIEITVGIAIGASPTLLQGVESLRQGH
jgi:hypothetical protein